MKTTETKGKKKFPQSEGWWEGGGGNAGKSAPIGALWLAGIVTKGADIVPFRYQGRKFSA